MMNIPPSHDRSKFSPPNAPTTFYRHRLLTLFDQNREKRLILIVGQAGQGKSTLAAKAIESAKRPAVWVNNDPVDANPACFMENLVAAFQNRWTSLDFSPVINDLATPLGPLKSQAIYFLWSKMFWQIAPASVRLVLDVLDQIPEESTTYQLIDALVRTAPKTVQICLISRKRPPIKIERLKIDNQAIIIENDILALNLGETASFLRQTYLPSLTDEVAHYIHTFTEGWLVGILIIAQWLGGKKRCIRKADLEELFGQTVPGQIYNYFAEEVFGSLSPSDQQFLIQTAFLDVLEPALIDKLLKRDNSSTTLQRLSRDYLFVQPFTDRSGKLFFRNHQLFKRFLDFGHNNKISTTVRRELCLRAAGHYATNGLMETSLTYYLKARKYPEAGKILARIGIKLISRGQTEHLDGYLNRIPAEERQKSAWLLLFEAVILRAKQSPQALENLFRCREMFVSNSDDIGHAITLAYLIETAFLFGHSPIDMDQLLAEAKTILSNDNDVAASIQARLWLQIGFATIRGMGNFSEALSVCQTAYLLAKAGENVNMQCHSLSLSKLACAYLGEFDKADDLDQRIELLLPECSTEIKTFHLSSQCLFNIYRGRKKEAVADLLQFEAEVEKYSFLHFYAWLTICKCLLYPRIGKVAEAEQILARWLQTCTEPTFRRAVALLLEGFCAYYRANVVKGTAALEEAAEIFNKGPLRSEFQYQNARKGLGIVAYLLKDYAKADITMQEVLIYASTINSYTLIAEAHLLIGLNRYASGDIQGAHYHLRSAFDIITTRRLRQLVVTHNDDLACACLLAVKLQVMEDLSWVKELLAQNANLAILCELKEEIEKTHSAGRKKVLKESLEAIIQAKLPRLEIRTFKELSVLKDGDPISRSQWKGAGTQRFLAVLLARGGRRVPQDLIIDDLWPDSPAKAAHSNFKSAMHRLRKVFEPRKVRYQPSQYLYARNNQLGLDQSLCSIDFETFEQAAQKALRTSDETKKIQMAQQAIDIYKGAFLSDELYTPAIISQREHLEEIYLRMIDLLSSVYIKNGEYELAVGYLEKWLKADPYSETACRRLMRLYCQSGRPERALRLFKSFETLLKNDLQLNPDTKTQVLFREIKNQESTNLAKKLARGS